ncbi:Fc receptor-like protein 5 isoform X1 [Leopardus geoffroyi]|uniref:Fc receptor-like protein 5 isoform X1 n=1 Tax=Leopardus geoffroyi TaxID=46844 RepID=UPI001E260452|nr:Fc receptor-like protein 5 isoform X1 [Leopardus geoffroyi]
MSSSGLLWSCASQESKPALLLLRKALVWPHPGAGQAFMLLWVSVLVLAPVSGKSEAAPKPVISLHPPWTVAFRGETVTLTCNVFHFHAPEKIKRFLWYLGRRRLRETPGNTLEVRDSGQYGCQTQDSLPSDQVSLTFSSENLILQAPPFVFEGDSVVLRCRANAEITLDAMTLHRRGEVLSVSDDSSDFRIEQASLKDNGDYHCSGFKNGCCSYSSNMVNIEVQELFPRPVLTASLSPTVSGKSVTLTCKTQLPPLRSDVKLWFRFFKDDQVLHLGSESFLKIPTLTTRSRDPPYYWCEAQRGSSGVCKQSQKSQLHVQIPVSRPVLTLSPHGASVPEGHTVTLTCKAESGSFPILYQFLREEVVIQKMEPTRGVKSVMSLRAEHSGNYYCTADNGLGAQRSLPVYLTVTVPVSRPVLTLSPRGALVPEGHTVTLSCKAERGSPPILYKFYHENISLGRRSVLSAGGVFLRVTVTVQDSGNYFCTADNGFGPQRSEAKSLSVKVPVSRPILTIRRPRSQVVEGDVVELYCGAWKGSPPILYRFYHEDNALGSSRVYNRRGASFKLPLSAEHSGKYACEADNGLGAWRSETVSLDVKVPASRPVLTVRTPRAQAVEGDVVELHCEAQRGSPPILYRFYHEENALGSSRVHSRGGASFKLPLSAEHSGKYACEADNGLGAWRSETVSLDVKVPASRPVLTVRTPRAQAVEGDVVELRCEAQRGSPPILYRFYHEENALGSSRVHSRGGASFKLPLSAEHSGKYACEADNGLGARRSETVSLNVTVPASRPVLTVRTPRAQAVEGDVVELRCEAQRGSPPILYQFYREDVPLESSSAPSGGGTSFYLSLTTEHSGNYSCEADNGLGAQRSEVVPLSVIVPASHPTLTLRVPGAQAKVGDMVELHCEAQRGSPPIWYWFYHEDVPLGNSSAPSGGGASLNLSLTAEHSGNYSCEADNGLGARRSEAVPLSMSGLTGSRSGPIATGVTGGLFSTLGFGVVALLLYCWLPRKAGGRLTSDPSRSPSDSDVREPVYHNAPAWLELQPVYSNVNPKGGEVVYSEVRRIPQGSKPAANSDSVLGLLRTHPPSHGQAASHRPSDPPGSSVIYSQVKVACPSAYVAPQS